MRPAEVGVVDDDHVALGERALVLDDLARRLLHHPEEDGEPQLALRDDLPVVPVVDAVGAVERLGDDRGERRLLVDQVHLARDLAEPVLDDGQGNGVGSGIGDGVRDGVGGVRIAGGGPVRARGHGNEQVAEAVDLRHHSGLDGDGGVELLDDGGALDRRPGRERRAVVDGGLVPLAVEAHPARAGARVVRARSVPRPG